MTTTRILILSAITLVVLSTLVVGQNSIPLNTKIDTTITFSTMRVTIPSSGRVVGTITLSATSTSSCTISFYTPTYKSQAFNMKVISPTDKTFELSLIPNPSDSNQEFTFSTNVLESCPVSIIFATQSQLALGDRPSNYMTMSYNFQQSVALVPIVNPSRQLEAIIPPGYKAVGKFSASDPLRDRCHVSFASKTILFDQFATNPNYQYDFSLVPDSSSVSQTFYVTTSTQGSLISCYGSFQVQLQPRSDSDVPSLRGTPSNPSTDGPNVGAIVGGIIGGIAMCICLTAIVIGIIVFLCGGCCCALGAAGAAAGAGVGAAAAKV